MGDAAGEKTKALRITAIVGDGASTRVPVPLVEQQRQAPSLTAAAADVAASAGRSAEVQSCGEDDDEQVERFYALLANIRALRGLYSAEDGGRSGPSAGRGRKRAREAEAPWRPAFRMEDFEEEVSQVTADSRCAVLKQSTSGGGTSRAAAARARAAADDHEEDEVAEARGRKLGRCVAARV